MLRNLNLMTVLELLNVSGDELSQSKFSSLVESAINTGLGIILSTVFTQVICLVYSIELDIHDNLIITFWLTVVSFLRAFIIRLVFNKWSEDD